MEMTTNYNRQLNKMMGEYGYVLKRNKSHLVYHNPVSKKVQVLGQSPKNKDHTLMCTWRKLEREKNGG